MELIIFWLITSVLAGGIASNKGRSFMGFFLLALLLSPLVGIIAALIAAPINAGVNTIDENGMITEASRTCPYCAEDIKSAAIVCKHCGRDLPSEVEKPTEEVKQKEDIYIC